MSEGAAINPAQVVISTVREFSKGGSITCIGFVKKTKPHGHADCVAKEEGVTLTCVETQSDKYTKELPDVLPAWGNPLPFSYQSTDIETRFIAGLDLEHRHFLVQCSRRQY